MSHVSISHVTHTNESCHTCTWGMSNIRMSHVTHTKVPRRLYASRSSKSTRAISHIPTRTSQCWSSMSIGTHIHTGWGPPEACALWLIDDGMCDMTYQYATVISHIPTRTGHVTHSNIYQSYHTYQHTHWSYNTNQHLPITSHIPTHALVIWHKPTSTRHITHTNIYQSYMTQTNIYSHITHTNTHWPCHT